MKCNIYGYTFYYTFYYCQCNVRKLSPFFNLIQCNFLNGHERKQRTTVIERSTTLFNWDLNSRCIKGIQYLTTTGAVLHITIGVRAPLNALGCVASPSCQRVRPAACHRDDVSLVIYIFFLLSVLFAKS